MREKGDYYHRTRASVIVLDKKERRFLMMYRKTQGKEKYVLLGGGVEENETVENAAKREVLEEAGLCIDVDKKLAEIRYKTCTDHVFLATRFSGEVKLGGEEIERISEENIYHPEWIKVDDLKNLKIPIYPGLAVRLISKEINA
jgi:8-oxo-dGTP diphosphatase